MSSRQGGFTLTEALVAVALFSLFAMGALAAFSAVQGSMSASANRLHLSLAPDQVRAVIGHALSEATCVTAPAAGAAADRLAGRTRSNCNGVDVTGAGTVSWFMVCARDGRVFYGRGDAPLDGCGGDGFVPVTSNLVAVTALSFSRAGLPPNSVGVELAAAVPEDRRDRRWPMPDAATHTWRQSWSGPWDQAAP